MSSTPPEKDLLTKGYVKTEVFSSEEARLQVKYDTIYNCLVNASKAELKVQIYENKTFDINQLILTIKRGLGDLVQIYCEGENAMGCGGWYILTVVNFIAWTKFPRRVLHIEIKPKT